MGTQKNRLNEMILFSTHNIGFVLIIREKLWEKELNTPPNLDLCNNYLFDKSSALKLYEDMKKQEVHEALDWSPENVLFKTR